MRSFIFCLTILLLFSCTPKGDSSKTEQSGEGQASKESESSTPSLTMVRTDKAPPIESGLDAESPEGEEWDEFSGPLFLQRIKPHTYILADSIIVGKQVDPLSSLLSEREADYLAREFLRGYRDGRVRTDLFTANVHPLFLEELEEFKKEGPEIQGFYLGTFSLSGVRSMVRVVLLSETGYIRGVLYLQNENGLWGIQDWEMPINNWPGDPLPVAGNEMILPGSL